MKKKIYVASGELAVVMVADGPLDAIKKALHQHGAGKTLDGDYFYLDERGFRQNDTAQYKVPVEQALAEAGYVFDDPSDDSDGGCGVPTSGPPPQGLSPSAEG